MIDFRYISADEPLDADQEDKDIVFRIGKNSRRLYRIEIDVDKLKAQKVSLQLKPTQLAARIDQAINTFAKKVEKVRQRENYRIAKEAIVNNKNQLFKTESLSST